MIDLITFWHIRLPDKTSLIEQNLTEKCRIEQKVEKEQNGEEQQESAGNPIKSAGTLRQELTESSKTDGKVQKWLIKMVQF